MVSIAGPWASVQMGDEEPLCRIDERMMFGRSSVLAPGDEVFVEPEEDALFIRASAPRRTKLSRPAIQGGRVREQIIAANVDVLVIVASVLRPRFKPGLVDRYLVAAGVGGVTPLLCINKLDLVEEEPKEIAVYREVGLQVIATSCLTGDGIEELHDALRGKLSVLAGHSGVGKSSILNAMDASLDIRTREVSDYSEKGKHTTSASRLYNLPGGVRVIDTPGIRELGLWGVSHEELTFFFPEIEALAPQCRFRNCTHTHEPECAVRGAVDAGEITRLRYESYRRIHESL